MFSKFESAKINFFRKMRNAKCEKWSKTTQGKDEKLNSL